MKFSLFKKEKYIIRIIVEATTKNSSNTWKSCKNTVELITWRINKCDDNAEGKNIPATTLEFINLQTRTSGDKYVKWVGIVFPPNYKQGGPDNYGKFNQNHNNVTFEYKNSK